VFDIDPETLRIAIGWGVVAAVLVWLAMSWAFPRELRDGRDQEDEL